MRDILFRGKRKDSGEWVFGCYAKFRNINNEIYTAIIPITKDECYISKSKSVIPETIGQYTGLCDKNGECIFEWDILKNEVGKLFVVIYKFGGFDLAPISWITNMDNTLTYNTLGDIQNAQYTMSNAKIVGNIYDNLELLEESK